MALGIDKFSDKNTKCIRVSDSNSRETKFCLMCDAHTVIKQQTHLEWIKSQINVDFK